MSHPGQIYAEGSQFHGPNVGGSNIGSQFNFDNKTTENKYIYAPTILSVATPKLREEYEEISNQEDLDAQHEELRERLEDFILEELDRRENHREWDEERREKGYRRQAQQQEQEGQDQEFEDEEWYYEDSDDDEELEDEEVLADEDLEWLENEERKDRAKLAHLNALRNRKIEPTVVWDRDDYSRVHEMLNGVGNGTQNRQE